MVSYEEGNKMRKKMRIFPGQCLVIALVLLFAAPNYATVEKDTTRIDRILYAGPIPVHFPAFYDDSLQVRDLIELQPLDTNDLLPQAGKILHWSQDKTFSWKIAQPDSSGLYSSPVEQDSIPELSYYTVYIKADEWAQCDLVVSTAHPFQLFADGRLVNGTKQHTAIKSDSLYQQTTFHLNLEPGKHALVIKSLYNPLLNNAATIESKLIAAPKYRNVLHFSLDPEKFVSIENILKAARPRNIQISSNGKYAAVTIRRQTACNPKGEEWLELYDLENGALEETLRSYTFSSFKWVPGGNCYSYITSKNDSSTLWMVDARAGTSRAILQDFKNLKSYTWSPDASFVIFSAIEEKEEKKSLRRHAGLLDRLPGSRNKEFLYRLNIPQGTLTKLTSGNLSTHLSSISPDSKKVIFQRDRETLNRRPYIQNQLFLLDLENMSLDSLWYGYWLSDIKWSPDGKQLLMTGGPTLFGDIGKNVPDDLMPNEYDTQAYIYDLETGAVKVISKSFKPSILSAKWAAFDKNIYVLTVDKSYQHLYQYDVNQDKFEPLTTDCDVIVNFNMAKTKPLLGFIGSSVSTPHQAFIYDYNKGATALSDPAKTHFEHIRFGRVEPWTFYNKDSEIIYGRIYYPPDFNPDKTYPCIVYYYGGTFPVERSFGGRYPKNVWAANGYIVYVMQPSGSVGFGQSFSALHVNDWGKVVSDDIITGVEYFLKLHSFVDPQKVACIGASYGGFMTMHLLTQTDLFAAAVAHAGISALTSYWGQGYWGYLYSATATANSFPWNRKDIYVDQSPIYAADKITTPLLLLHGKADTNVPPGESYQLYTSLKLLGRDVELVTVKGENHHILTFNKRLTWSKTIIAWFDKYLKDKPDWWNHLYPQP